MKRNYIAPELEVKMFVVENEMTVGTSNLVQTGHYFTTESGGTGGFTQVDDVQSISFARLFNII